jgi:glycerol-3-phosphate cytidylyltransferase
MESTPEIGVITGNFDIIHLGYVRLFKELDNSCNSPFVLLHGDPSIERSDKHKPLHTIEERIEMIKPHFPYSMATYMVYNTEDELYTLLKSLRPDVRLMGDDYIGKPYTGDDLGIPIKWIDRSHGWSTTKFKKLIANTTCK